MLQEVVVEPGLLTVTPDGGLPVVINGQQVVTEGGVLSIRKQSTLVSVSAPTGYVDVLQYKVILDLTNLRQEVIWMGSVTNHADWTNDEAGTELAVEEIKEALTSGGGGGGGTVTSVSGSGGTTGLTLTGGPITGSGTLTLGGTLAVANGGTGSTTPAAARTALGLPLVFSGLLTQIDTDPPAFAQIFNNDYGIVPVTSYTSTGQYIVEFPGSTIDPANTSMHITTPSPAGGNAGGVVGEDEVIVRTTDTSGAYADGVIEDGATITITTYPT